MKLDLTGLPVKPLLLIAVSFIGITSISIFVKRNSPANSLEKTAEEDLKAHFSRYVIPYKDMKIEVLSNDGTRARVKAVFTVQTGCGVIRDDTKSSSENRKLGYQLLSAKEENEIKLMGLDGFYGYSEKGENYNKWKRCYTIQEYAKVGDKWNNETELQQQTNWNEKGMRDWAYHPYFLPPSEQEKLGYKLTDDQRNNFDEDASVRDAVGEFYNAVMKSYGLKGDFAWKVDLNGVALGDASMVSKPNGYIYQIINTKELKEDFIDTVGVNRLNKIFVTSKADQKGLRQNFSVCFLPKSMKSMNFDRYGEPKPECSTGDKSGKECYWCIK